ncbi:alkylmercury lyase [Natrinema sp. CBA1119]|uniref:organomercurial lyase n=1 Tax=Natrinema sp. CBA1119 TaxID=1608465 RepID=UPI000BF52086|nr:organomercurial lyase [Natrinema sp. CBA1119]PGF16056.1 alkylmercury lyase [Natrinema sp. CBA1119]
MGDDPCPCDSATDGQADEPESTSDRWIPETPVLEAPLPSDVRAALGRLLGEEAIETLAEWCTEIRRRTGGGPIAVDDLCHTGEETAHRGETDGKRYYFRCFYDAVILSALAETPVAIRTESPGGAVIEARAVGTTELTVTPETAVFSVGVDETVALPPDDGPSHSTIYAAVCPYVRAFPDLEAYERWATTVPAATVAMPLAGATELAAELVA